MAVPAGRCHLVHHATSIGVEVQWFLCDGGKDYWVNARFVGIWDCQARNVAWFLGGRCECYEAGNLVRSGLAWEMQYLRGQRELQIGARTARQAVLTKDKPPKVDLILGEIALRQVMGSHKIMARQLRAMLEIVDLPNVRLRVVPFAQSGNAGLDSPFHRMDFPRDQSVVFWSRRRPGFR